MLQIELKKKFFDYYLEVNWKLERSWAKIKEVCKCKSWTIPRQEETKLCLVLKTYLVAQEMRFKTSHCTGLKLHSI